MLGKEIPRLRSSKNLLYLNGKDLRALPLIERKAILKRLLRRKRSGILYIDHVESEGRLVFEQIVKMDLEGLTVQGNGEAIALLDQGQEFAVQPARRTRGIV